MFTIDVRRSVVLTFILMNLVAVSARGIPQDSESASQSPLPVSGVTLFTSGVGYFQHEGLIDGDVEIALAFDAEDIDDLLKSLVLQDFDGGTVEAVTYPSKDPIGRILGSFSLNIADNPSLARLLDRARGEEVRIEGPSSVEGAIMGIEYRTQVSEGATKQVPVLNLAASDGLRQVLLEDIRSFRFLDPSVRAELDAALAVIADNRQEDKKILTLSFVGEGRRRVGVSYVREVPVWKTSYRLVIGDDGNAQIQGWAMVENTGENDWKDVDLSLATGQPISFVMDLYTPVYVPRPRVRGEYGVAAAPQSYERDRAMANSEASSPSVSGFAAETMADEGFFEDFAKAPPPEPQPIDLAGGVQAAADTIGESIYRIRRPVNVPRREAAMLPIVNTVVPIRRLSIFDAGVLSNSPLKAVRLTNDSGVDLPAGPATLFDGAFYGGDVRIPEMGEGEDRLLSYAVDTGSHIIVESESEPEKIIRLRISDGVLESTVRLVSKTEYRIERLSDEPSRHLIIHPKRSGWNIEGEVQPESETAGTWRFEVDVDGNQSVTMPVVEEYIQSRNFSLSSLRDDRIAFYLSQSVIDPDTRTALVRIRTLRQTVSAREAERRRIEADIAVIHREQDRIRENLRSLESGSDLYKRYVEILDGQEDDLIELSERLSGAKNAEEAARRALADYIASI
jgi:hypothetical protein